MSSLRLKRTKLSLRNSLRYPILQWQLLANGNERFWCAQRRTNSRTKGSFGWGLSLTHDFDTLLLLWRSSWQTPARRRRTWSTIASSGMALALLPNHQNCAPPPQSRTHAAPTLLLNSKRPSALETLLDEKMVRGNYLKACNALHDHRKTILRFLLFM